VCGLSWPANDDLRTPGVDAAHILPWAKYDLDVVPNGLCLCKQHHWAFDHLLIGIVADGSGFRIGLTDLAARAFGDNPAALAELKRFTGAVPENRLPSNKSEWPSAEFLLRFYEDVGIAVL
jgi:hypothetical protein